MEFNQQIVVSAPPERVWAFLWDIERVAHCIPGCQAAKVVEPGKRYEAVVGERVGPFKVQFPLEIEVLEAQPLTRLRAKATGRDHSLASSLQMRLDLDIEQAGNQTVLRLHTEVSIIGKIAVLGHSMITRKSDEIMTGFAEALRRELEGLQGDAATV